MFGHNLNVSSTTQFLKSLPINPHVHLPSMASSGIEMPAAIDLQQSPSLASLTPTGLAFNAPTMPWVDDVATSEITEEEIRLVGKAINKISYELVKIQSISNESFCLSAASITMVLGMVLKGLDAPLAERNFVEKLGLELIPKERLLSTFGAFAKAITDPSANGQTTISIANAIAVYASPDRAINSKYIKSMQNTLNSEVFPISTNPAQAADAINTWVLEKTNKEIEHLITADAFDNNTLALLLNAMYFKALWRVEFDHTIDDLFTCANGKQVMVRMMHDEGDYNVFDGNNFVMIERNYKSGDRKYSYLAVIPKKGFDIKEVEAQLTPKLMNQYRRQMKLQSVKFFMPRSDLRSKNISLYEQLKELGYPVSAFLGHVRSDVEIGRIIHETRVRCDEEGTIASAANAVVYKARCYQEPRESITIKADKPHMFMIISKTEFSDTILFQGSIKDESALITKEQEQQIQRSDMLAQLKATVPSRPITENIERTLMEMDPYYSQLKEKLLDTIVGIPQVEIQETPNAKFIVFNYTEMDLHFDTERCPHINGYPYSCYFRKIFYTEDDCYVVLHRNSLGQLCITDRDTGADKTINTRDIVFQPSGSLKFWEDVRKF